MSDFTPFSIEIRPGKYRKMRSVEDLAAVLLTRRDWPTGGGKRRAALEACLKALEGTGTAEQARWCFIEAAKEAGFFMREG